MASPFTFPLVLCPSLISQYSTKKLKIGMMNTGLSIQVLLSTFFHNSVLRNIVKKNTKKNTYKLNKYEIKTMVIQQTIHTVLFCILSQPSSDWFILSLLNWDSTINITQTKGSHCQTTFLFFKNKHARFLNWSRLYVPGHNNQKTNR